MKKFEVYHNFDVSQISYNKIGGIISNFYDVYTKSGLIKVLKTITNHHQDYYIVGGASKILFPTQFIRQNLIRLKNDVIVESDLDIYVGAGTPLKKVVAYFIMHGYKGISALLGIPGTIGGAIVNNAGAFLQEIKDVILSVEVFDQGHFKKLEVKDLKLTYRHSIFKEQNLIIFSATLKKIRGNKAEEIAIAKEAIFKRCNSQPQHENTLGSTFKNNYPHIIARELDELGVKGMNFKDVKISTKHANFLLNLPQIKQKNYLNILVILRSFVYNKFEYMPDVEVIILRW